MSLAFLNFPNGLGNKIYDTTNSSKPSFHLKLKKMSSPEDPSFRRTTSLSASFLQLEDVGTKLNVSDTW